MKIKKPFGAKIQLAEILFFLPNFWRHSVKLLLLFLVPELTEKTCGEVKAELTDPPKLVWSFPCFQCKRLSLLVLGIFLSESKPLFNQNLNSFCKKNYYFALISELFLQKFYQIGTSR